MVRERCYRHVNVSSFSHSEPCDRFLQFLPVLLQRQTPESKLDTQHHFIHLSRGHFARSFNTRVLQLIPTDHTTIPDLKPHPPPWPQHNKNIFAYTAQLKIK